jgi:hypothetical protein
MLNTFFTIFSKPSNYTPPDTSAPLPTAQITDANLDEALKPGYIPEPPSILDDNIILNVLGEPTFESLGLTSYYWPPCWVRSALEYLHVNWDLNWVASIVVFTIALRTLLFYLTIVSQRNSASMRRLTPTMNKLKEKMDLAKSTGNPIDGTYFSFQNEKPYKFQIEEFILEFLANLVSFKVEKNPHLTDRGSLHKKLWQKFSLYLPHFTLSELKSFKRKQTING